LPFPIIYTNPLVASPLTERIPIQN
jgi:hypothetical protein